MGPIRNPNWSTSGMRVTVIVSTLILYQSKNCGHRIHYNVYWYCQMKKNEWLWKFWKRNDLYENFEKKGVVEKRGEEETKSMPHAPVVYNSSNKVIFVIFAERQAQIFRLYYFKILIKKKLTLLIILCFFNYKF